MQRFTIGLTLLCIPLGLGHCVNNNIMAPTLPKYSWVWMSNDTSDIAVGDVVQVTDPNNPTTQHWLRVVGTMNERIQYQNDGFKRNGKRIPVLDMREWDADSRVWKETVYVNNQEIYWEIIQPNSTSGWQSPSLNPKSGEVVVSCDNRANCVDSRWWGPLSTTLIEGVVQFGVCLFCKEGMNSKGLVLYY